MQVKGKLCQKWDSNPHFLPFRADVLTISVSRLPDVITMSTNNCLLG